MSFHFLGRLLVAGVLAGCGAASPRGSTEPRASADAVVARCNPDTIPLAVERNRDGLPTRVYVKAQKGAEAGLGYFDTGAAHTHLFHPLGGSTRAIPNAGRVTIGCTELTLDSWRHRDEPRFRGEEVVATIGDDFLASSIIEVDLQSERMIRHHDENVGTGPGWTRLAIEIVKGIPITRVTLDGKPLRLTLDTGAWNLQLLDPNPVGEATVRPARDVFGNPIIFLRGDGLLTLGDAPGRRVSVYRTRAFPAFERQRSDLGGDIDGILGLSSLGASRIIFDFPHHEVRLAT